LFYGFDSPYDFVGAETLKLRLIGLWHRGHKNNARNVTPLRASPKVHQFRWWFYVIALALSIEVGLIRATHRDAIQRMVVTSVLGTPRYWT